jgi:uncharacterized protein (DUF362 family)
MGDIVSLVRVKNSDDIKRSILGAVDLAEFRFPNMVKSVAIKPSAMRTKYAFKVLGYEKLAEEKKVELFNLSKGVLEEKTVQVDKREITFKVPGLLLDSDLFIDVPKLKLMRIVKITCAMKNIFGCIGKPRKIVYHPILNETIVGINKVLKPHLTIVDGLVAAGRFPIKLNLIMASVDPFSIDWVASQIMGYKPSRVKFLKIAIKEKVGDPKGILTRGEEVEKFAKIFPKEGFISTSFLWSIQFWLLKAYQKIVGDIIPPVLEG